MSAPLEMSVVPANFLLVDDHPLFLEALRVAVEAAYEGASVSEAGSIAEAKEAIARHGRFDLVLLDLSMPDASSFSGLIELRALYPRLPIVIVSAMDDPRIIHGAMSSGAAGFIPKSARKSELAAAIREVMSGAVTLPKGYEPPAAKPGASEPPGLTQRLSSLTPQQLRVLHMLRQGKLNKQIAFELDVGETTVKAHVSEILRKLGVASRTQAVIEAGKVDFAHLLDERGRDGSTG